MNNMYNHVMETLNHKKCVIDASCIMVDYLFKNGRDEDAIELARRCSVHDNSKLIGEELHLFSQLPTERSGLKNPNESIPPNIQKTIEIHWKNNRHHPEHFSSYKNMNEIDIMEMVCDWYARSLQYNTNFLDFIETRQKTRFQFDEVFFAKVYNYCKILNDHSNKLKNET